MAKEASSGPPPSATSEFVIPVELLKAFKNDVRTIPNVLPANGWIIFDRAMLISVLRSDDPAARKDIANHLERFGKAGGELVMMQRPSLSHRTAELG